MPIIPQSQIPTLALLYAAKRLRPSPTAVFEPSADLNTRVGYIRTDITTLELPNGAIVNAANKGLRGGGGVDGAIHRAAGSDLLRECRTLGGCDTGFAKITDAYKLPCKKVIHAVGPVYSMEDDSRSLLVSCYNTALKLAVENGLDSIAFSALSTGIYGYPSRLAARAAIETVRDFLFSEEGKSLKLVVFCNFEKKDELAYFEWLPYFFPPVERSGDYDASKAADAAKESIAEEAEKEVVTGQTRLTKEGNNHEK